MEMLKKEGLEENVDKFDFTTFELNYIMKNARFNDEQLRVFNRLTDIHGRQTITKISIEENMSTAKVSRLIKQIKDKIIRIL